ncbi:MAG: hypothetical protein ABI581_16675, partial [Sediminibacterium sp.]
NYQASAYSILSGHSLGALMAVSCLINHPDYFNAYIAISPSLQWDNEIVLKQASDLADTKKWSGKRLFFSNGNEDGMKERQVRLQSILLQKKQDGLLFSYVDYPGEAHAAVPIKAFYDGIRLIYPEWYMPLSNAAFKQNLSSEIVKNHYRKLSTAYGYTVIPPVDEINAIARFLRNDPKKVADALDLLNLNISNYPASVSVYETTGDTYARTGDMKNALVFYNKALALDPSNASVQSKIKKIQP